MRGQFDSDSEAGYFQEMSEDINNDNQYDDILQSNINIDMNNRQDEQSPSWNKDDPNSDEFRIILIKKLSCNLVIMKNEIWKNI